MVFNASSSFRRPYRYLQLNFAMTEALYFYRREIFNWSHRIVGIVALLMASKF